MTNMEEQKTGNVNEVIAVKPEEIKTYDEPTIKDLGEYEWELPIGYTDEDGKIHKRFTLREMTGYTEEQMSKKDVRSNIGKVMTKLILGVLDTLGDLEGKEINEKVVKSLTTVDRDYILLMNYKYSIEDKMVFNDVCNSCEEILEISVDPEKIPVHYIDDKTSTLFYVDLPRGFQNPNGGERLKYMELTLPDGGLQEKLYGRKDLTSIEALTITLSYITTKIRGMNNYNYLTFQHMTTRDRKHISEEIQMKIGPELTVPTTCPDCGHNQKSVIPAHMLLGE